MNKDDHLVSTFCCIEAFHIKPFWVGCGRGQVRITFVERIESSNCDAWGVEVVVTVRHVRASRDGHSAHAERCYFKHFVTVKISTFVPVSPRFCQKEICRHFIY